MSEPAPAAEPAYAIGQVVHYVDHHGRPQLGAIGYIEASWSRAGRAPLIIYTVEHPTYRNRRMYAGTSDIRGLAYSDQRCTEGRALA